MIFYDIQMKCAFFGFCSVLFSLTLTKRAIMRYPVPWYMLCDNNSKTQFGHALNHKIKCVDFGYNTTIFLVWFAILLLLLLNVGVLWLFTLHTLAVCSATILLSSFFYYYLFCSYVGYWCFRHTSHTTHIRQHMVCHAWPGSCYWHCGSFIIAHLLFFFFIAFFISLLHKNTRKNDLLCVHYMVLWVMGHELWDIHYYYYHNY